MLAHVVRIILSAAFLMIFSTYATEDLSQDVLEKATSGSITLQKTKAVTEIS